MWLACSVTVATNIIVHPLCTAKNRLMAGEVLFPGALKGVARLGSLYRGLTAICITESSYYGPAYLLNGSMQSISENSLFNAAVAGFIASPISAVGEEAMIKRQVSRICFRQSMGKAASISSLAATALRDVPFTVALLGGKSGEGQNLSQTSALVREFAGGFFAGAIAGVITTPCDTIKTLVQARGCTFYEAARSYAELTRGSGGFVLLIRAVSYRSLYIGLSIGLMRVLNERFAERMPEVMRRDKSL